MYTDVVRYEGAIFRPPSEAYSLIIQSTIGCSNNTCHFCGAFREKVFRLRPLEEVLEDLFRARAFYTRVDRIFFADGDALIRPTEDWIALLECIRAQFPECTRVSTYASPRSLLLKTPEELTQLRQLGLAMVYMGLESGSDTVLEDMCKNATAAQIIEAGHKAKAAGMKLSVTAISGLGGQELWEEHAVETGRAFTAMKPDYIGLLTLIIEPQTPLGARYRRGEFHPLDPTDGVFRETKLMLEHTDCDGCVFRSNHASNYLPLGGTLNRDRAAMIARLDSALEGGQRLRPDWMRGL